MHLRFLYGAQNKLRYRVDTVSYRILLKFYKSSMILQVLKFRNDLAGSKYSEQQLRTSVAPAARLRRVT